MFKLAIDFLHEHKNKLYAVAAIFSFFSLHLYGFVENIPREMIPFIDTLFTTSFFLTFVMFLSAFALMYKIFFIVFSNFGKSTYSLFIFVQRILFSIDLRNDKMYRSRLMVIRRIAGTIQTKIAKKYANLISFGLTITLVFFIYGSLDLKLFITILSISATMSLLYFTLFKNDVDVIIQYLRRRPVPDRVLVQCTERASPFLVVVLLLFSMLLGDARAVKLMGQEELVFHIKDTTASGTIIGSTSSGYIVYTNNREQFLFINNSGEITIYARED